MMLCLCDMWATLRLCSSKPELYQKSFISWFEQKFLIKKMQIDYKQQQQKHHRLIIHEYDHISISIHSCTIWISYLAPDLESHLASTVLLCFMFECRGGEITKGMWEEETKNGNHCSLPSHFLFEILENSVLIKLVLHTAWILVSFIFHINFWSEIILRV